MGLLVASPLSRGIAPFTGSNREGKSQHGLRVLLPFCCFNAWCYNAESRLVPCSSNSKGALLRTNHACASIISSKPSTADIPAHSARVIVSSLFPHDGPASITSRMSLLAAPAPPPVSHSRSQSAQDSIADLIPPASCMSAPDVALLSASLQWMDPEELARRVQLLSELLGMPRKTVNSMAQVRLPSPGIWGVMRVDVATCFRPSQTFFSHRVMCRYCDVVRLPSLQ